MEAEGAHAAFQGQQQVPASSAAAGRSQAGAHNLHILKKFMCLEISAGGILAGGLQSGQHKAQEEAVRHVRAASWKRSSGLGKQIAVAFNALQQFRSHPHAAAALA